MASPIRAAFEKKNYKFANDGLDERCASLAESHVFSAEEIALEFEKVMLQRCCSEANVTASMNSVSSSLLCCALNISLTF